MGGTGCYIKPIYFLGDFLFTHYITSSIQAFYSLYTYKYAIFIYILALQIRNLIGLYLLLAIFVSYNHLPTLNPTKYSQKVSSITSSPSTTSLKCSKTKNNGIITAITHSEDLFILSKSFFVYLYFV